jgi:anti-sigma factor ChrR (cupin superfamily)
VSDHTATLVLPENEFTKRRQTPRSEVPADPAAFDETLVLEDDLEQRRRRSATADFAR